MDTDHCSYQTSPPTIPFAKFEGNFWKGRIQYNAIYAIHQNLYRLSAFETVEATYERKIGTYHYLDFAITPNIQLGIFEGAHWRRSDSLGSTSPNWLFINPVIGVNAAVMNGNDSTYNHILGANFSWTFFNYRLYGQAVLDNGFGGFQIGVKAYDLFTPKLDIQAEFNHVNKEATYPTMRDTTIRITILHLHIHLYRALMRLA